MMRSKYTPWVIASIGLIGSIVAVFVIIGVWISPTQAAIDAAQSRYDAAYQGSTPLVRAQVQKQLDQANAAAAKTKADWAIDEKTLMPPLDVSNRGLAWKQLSYELSEHLGPMLEHWLAHQDVISNVAITVPGPPPSPNGITPNLIRLPVGSGNISVQGDFRSILAHVLRWNDFNRLVLIDRLALSGNSPLMTGTYTAYIYIYPQNADKIGATIARNGGGGAAFSGGGGGGGGGGNIPSGVARGAGG
jgi:hypothetical protein